MLSWILAVLALCVAAMALIVAARSRQVRYPDPKDFQPRRSYDGS